MSLRFAQRFAVATLATFALFVPAVRADLTIGSKAPKLDIEHWLSNNQGKLPKVESFKADNVYVVEFWATWCGPCVASMPHLAQLQKTYAEKGVQIISVSDEELAVVEKFLDRKVPGNDQGDEGEKKSTFRELTSGYCLTTDPDQSVYTDYMEAAGEGGIPTAFIVGKDGFIEWIGHPMEMDEPLAEVVAGKWDRQKYIKIREERQKIQEGMQEVFAYLQKDQPDKALENLDKLIALASDPEIKASLSGVKIQIMMETKPEEAAKQLTELINKTNEVEALNMVAWQVVEMAMSDESEVPAPLLNAAILAAEKAVKLSPKDGAILDTLAHLMQLKGDIDQAITLQKKAVELTPEMPELKMFLKQLEKTKQESSK